MFQDMLHRGKKYYICIMYLKRKDTAPIITTEQGFEIPNVVIGIYNIIEVWGESIAVNCAYWINEAAMNNKVEPLKSGRLDKFQYSFSGDVYQETKDFIIAMNGNVIAFIMDKVDFEGKPFSENWEVVQ